LSESTQGTGSLPAQPYISEPGVVSSSPVSRHVLRPERIIGHRRRAPRDDGPQRLRRLSEPVAKLVVVRQVEHRAEGCRPSVAEQLPTVVNLKLGAPCLNPGLVEELEVSPVVQLPDNCARRESCPTSDGRTGPVLAHPGRIDDQRPGRRSFDESSQGPSPTCPATRASRRASEVPDGGADRIGADESRGARGS